MKYYLLKWGCMNVVDHLYPHSIIYFKNDVKNRVWTKNKKSLHSLHDLLQNGVANGVWTKK